MKIPELNIEPGFYYHFKHDDSTSVNNFAYEVLSVGICTEDESNCDGGMVIYRPLYENEIYNSGKFCYLRTVGNWLESVSLNGKLSPRFVKVIDEKLISELTSIKTKMYN